MCCLLCCQVDDCNGNVGLRSPSLLRTPNSNGRSNPVLIPRPACIGVEDDNYFNYHYSKLSAMAEAGAGSIEVVDSKTAMAATTQMEKPASDKSPEADSCGKPSSSTRDEHSCPTGDQCKHDRGAVCQVYKFRRSICYAVHFWIRQFPVHFDLDARLCVLIKEWQRQLLTNPCTATESRTWYYPELAPLMDLTCLPSYDWIRNISVRDPTVKHCRKVSLVFNHLEPCDLAKHLTYLEHRIMRRISVSWICLFHVSLKYERTLELLSKLKSFQVVNLDAMTLKQEEKKNNRGGSVFLPDALTCLCEALVYLLLISPWRLFM